MSLYLVPSLRYQAHRAHGKFDSEVKLEDVAELAHEIIADVRANPPPANPVPPLDPGTMQSFWIYPEGEALAYVA